MLKITKSIVNGDKALIGFVVTGKECEMGGFSNNIVERGMPINTMIKSNFSNKQISVVKQKLVEKGKFRINQLPMCVYAPGQRPDTDYIDVDNTIDLVQRLVQDNENIGFRVRFADGSEDNIKYANVLMMCKWFKPGNFAIRTSSKGNIYICGKEGCPLDSIPAIIIGEKPKTETKRMKSAAKQPVPEFNGAVESGYDILDIYGFIKDCHGAVIKLPDEQYIAASEGGEKMLTGFTSLGIGEVASPVPAFNATKINVNASFKKVGIVPVTINGITQNIVSFVYRNKSLFLNGENYMKKFGIAVPVEKEAELVAKLGKSLALEKTTDPQVINPLSQVINVSALAFYKINSGKIDLISAEKRKASILTTKQIIALLKQQYELKLISKALGPKGGLLKVIKDSLEPSDFATLDDRKPFGIFSMMNKEALDAVSAAGIDIYTGAYTEVGTPVEPKNSDASGVSTNVPVEIEYKYAKFNADKITGKKILQAVTDNDTNTVPEKVIEAIKGILNMNDLKAQYKAVKKLYDEVNAKITEINKRFWLHNASMYLDGNKSRIHVHDAKHWVPDTTTRVKNKQVYTCTSKGAEGLTVQFTGVTI